MTPHIRSFDNNTMQTILMGGTTKEMLIGDLDRDDDARRIGRFSRQVPELYRREGKGRYFIPPTLEENEAPLDPIITWWAVLYGLSMLARYRPSAWSAMLDVDRSPDAAAIEHLLRKAHKACVNFIFYHLAQSELWSQVNEGA